MIATLDTIPADNTLERYVLGIALGGGDKAVMDLEGILKPSDFFTPEHGEIYEALLTMLHQGRPLEIASVVTEFRRTGLMARIGQDKGDAGGADYLRELFDAYGFATTSLAYYAGELRAKSRLRALVTLGNHMTAAAKTPGADTGELVKEYQQTLYDLGRDGTGPSEVVSASEAVQESVARADRIAAGTEPPGLMTGFDGIDNALGGFQPGDLIVLGAGTSVGKSALAATMSVRVAHAGGPVLFVSAEMSRGSVANRLLAIVSGVSGSRLRTGNLDEYYSGARDDAQRIIDAWKFKILDRPATVAQIAVTARLLAARWQTPPSLIVVDYLQLMIPTGGDNKAQQISGIAWGLKCLAMELGCPILLLSQLNRAGLNQASDERPPSLYDLKESGDIENHSNVVLLLHRPSRAAPDTGGSVPIWCRVAKARDGRVTPWPATANNPPVPGSITLRFRPELTRFE